MYTTTTRERATTIVTWSWSGRQKLDMLGIRAQIHQFATKILRVVIYATRCSYVGDYLQSTIVLDRKSKSS